MRKALGILCIVGIFIALLSGCVGCNGNEKEEQTPVKDEIIIKEVHVNEQPLSVINTSESDKFANNYHNYQPYIDDNGRMYYYITRMRGDSAGTFLCYDDGVARPEEVGIPDAEYFSVGVILDGTIYGVEYEFVNFSYEGYITKYQNDKGTRLVDKPIVGCYFAEEGIYCQIDNYILLVDYDSNNTTTVFEIPNDLYDDEVASSRFIVYRGIFWYCVDYEESNCLFWCYDFDKTFIKFDNGGFEAVNNGYLYYRVMDCEYHNKLYRFNCETFSTELVCDNIDVLTYSFCNDYVLCTTYDGGGLYRIDADDNRKILSPEQMSQSEYISVVSCTDERIFVTGDSGLFYTCLAEIDIDGNIIRIIHEDEY